MKNPTTEEIREMLARGELPVPSGTTMDDLVDAAEAQFARILSELMSIPLERITVEIIEDLGMPGKIGVTVHFDPELTMEESAVYEVAMRVAVALLGSRPPLKMASA